ncbi:MAG TPA: magnesium transporter CorA family protein [Ilumatobacteraceae bacterium]|nr:magnesium transporter CorA family protein [Ilumatobacteraceae bacterium]
MITRHEFGDTCWWDVVDPTTEELESLDQQFGLGDRTFDEARRRSARPTMRRFADHAHLVAFSGTLGEVDMFVGDKWFVTIRLHDDSGREWDSAVALDRIQRLAPDVHTGMMLATVTEELVDGYFDSLDVLEDQLEAIEDRIFNEEPHPERKVQQDLFGVRRQLLELRRAVIPLREVLSALLRKEVEWVEGDALIVLRDTFDKLLRAVDIVDELRELVGNAVDAHLAVMSNQMNLVMKKLTAWGSIVFGATLIAGIYGMNFQHMPELGWLWGYPFALGSMVVLSFVLHQVFKRRDWL